MLLNLEMRAAAEFGDAGGETARHSGYCRILATAAGRFALRFQGVYFTRISTSVFMNGAHSG